jgi:hypothetical protein
MLAEDEQEAMTMDMEGQQMREDPERRRPKNPKPAFWGSVDLDTVNWQKELLWVVITEGVVETDELIQRFEDMGAEDVELEIGSMIGRGFFEEFNGYLRLHPDFSENCYAIIRN